MTAFNQLSSWVQVSSPITHADFTTHLNYLKCINRLSNGLTVTASDPSRSTGTMSPLVRKKKVLSNLTKNNLDSEMAQINGLNDYAQICSSWVPVKSYYLFFNLLMLLLYFQTGEERWLTDGHIEIKRKLTDLLRNGDIVFSIGSFNTIYIPSRILSWTIPSGNNVTTVNLNYGVLERQVIKKMLNYAKEDYKRIRNLSSLRGQNKQNFMNNTTINLCDFFYWYRIKANYRDMEFMELNVGTSEFTNFYTEYYELTNNFYGALTTEINRLARLRFGQSVF